MENTNVVDNHSILSRFITRGIKDLYERFNAISEEESDRVKNFIFETEGKVEFDIYKNYDLIKELSSKLDNVNNIDGIKLYIFLTQELRLELSVEEIRDYYQNLESKGYVKIQDYLLYFDYGEDVLEAIVEEELENSLEDEYIIMELFGIEEISYMWIFQTSPRMAAKQYIQDNGWYDYLETEDLGIAYLDKYDCEVYYFLNKRGDIFE